MKKVTSFPDSMVVLQFVTKMVNWNLYLNLKKTVKFSYLYIIVVVINILKKITKYRYIVEYIYMKLSY